MQNAFLKSIPLSELSLWDKLKGQRRLASFELELTARCDNNCRHCYINLPAEDNVAKEKEIPLETIERIADEAISLGALWCLLTGGEPLLRKDFFEIYLALKRKGLLVMVFTNATLITEEHIRTFKKYPPRDIEITVYGVTKETYERVTKVPGSFAAFMRGLNLLLENGIKVRLKAMALRSNVEQLPEISKFCRERTRDYFRFDPFLHLRLDGDSRRNCEIKSERLNPGEIVQIEQADSERFGALEKNCDRLIQQQVSNPYCTHIFGCSVGSNNFSVSYDGFFRLCSTLLHPECVYDLKKGTLTDAWQNFALRIRDMRSNKREFLKKCHACSLVNLCMWCPAKAHLETGALDTSVEYFCEVARAREKLLRG